MIIMNTSKQIRTVMIKKININRINKITSYSKKNKICKKTMNKDNNKSRIKINTILIKINICKKIMINIKIIIELITKQKRNNVIKTSLKKILQIIIVLYKNKVYNDSKEMIYCKIEIKNVKDLVVYTNITKKIEIYNNKEIKMKKKVLHQEKK